MKRLKWWQVVFATFLCSIVFVANSAADPTSLQVALYPYVPRLDQFKTVIEAEWKKIQPNVTINWVATDQWDGGYSTDPVANFDVYVFDAMYFDYFKSKGWLLGIPKSRVTNFSDILSYAANGVSVKDQVYAIPQLGCGDFLFYRKSDGGIASSTTLAQLAATIGSCTYYGTTPSSANVGLMVDLAGGITNASDYVVSLHEATNVFPVPLPYSPASVDKTAIANLQDVFSLSSFSNALYSDDSTPYQRANWFGQGKGRAYVGFMESLSQIDPAQLNTIAFKPMPWSDNPTGIQSPLFYSDVIGVNTTTQQRGTAQHAISLANLMASSDVMVKILGPSGTHGPQYLLPVRASVFRALGAQYPLYNDMYDVISNAKPIFFNLGPDAKNWLAGMKSTIKSMAMANPKCYCDVQAGPISNNDDAQTKCPTTCQNYGGWNGQWTTTVPGQMSVCGCNCKAVAR